MDIGKAFVFMFQDPEWLRKIAIGIVVALVGLVLSPILIGLIPLIMVAGYSLDVTYNVIQRREHPLPDWDDWGRFLIRGLKLVVVFLIWAIPLIIVALPIGIGAAFMSGDANNGGGALSVFGLMFQLCGGCLAILWGLVIALFTPALYARLAVTDQIGKCFDFAGLWAYTRDNIGNVIIAILLVWLAGLIASIIAPLGVIAIFIGLLVTVPLAILWQMLVQAHLYGQVAAASTTAIDTPATF
jgi:hypothetical protein